ncbi:PadR family transcriptional regulator [Aurantimicrobium minutum]|uniref:PadR family transcriptional regulator n=1 Tax=Aurantimicrobium minutum TaxID=708131 RepID=UPI002475472B|nr:PadR family transcriptional regulator [Aurantimicrobium minutum]MDH6537413.1 DNA-binding PadR family transcriptional regulator [Aurantimicrobium minutum]
MAVREALLGILTLGPAYGLQLHAELGARAPHRAKTNVGQVYGTLDRLSTAGLVVHQGLTDDGLPLYALTEAGKEEAVAWLEGNTLTVLPEWADVQDVVLISSSVSGQHATALLTKLGALLEQTPAANAQSPAQHLNEQAALRYREAVSAWLGDVQAAVIKPQPGYALGRPKRGRPAKS